jgi:high-affinity iron transporter
MAVDVFAVPVFLVVFRETLETVIIVSVLLAFLKQTLDGPNGDIKVYKQLRRQVNQYEIFTRSALNTD